MFPIVGHLISDSDMPLLDGLSAIKTILTMEPGLPVILASGNKNQSALVQDVGLSQFVRLDKPYGIHHLLNSAARALKGEKTNY